MLSRVFPSCFVAEFSLSHFQSDCSGWLLLSIVFLERQTVNITRRDTMLLKHNMLLFSATGLVYS